MAYVTVKIEVSKDKKTATIRFLSEKPMTSEQLWEVLKVFVSENEKNQQGEVVVN